MITDKEISLIPVDVKANRELILRIASANKHTHLTRERFAEALPFIKHTWIGHTRQKFCGVIVLCHLPQDNEWTLDAYKDDKTLKDIDNRGDFSYRSGRLVLDWFFKNKADEFIYSMHVKANRGATLICKRLGFEESGYIGDIIVLKLTRSKWESKL